MLGQPVTIECVCPVTGGPLGLEVDTAGPDPDLPHVARFGVPAMRWWEDIGHT